MAGSRQARSEAAPCSAPRVGSRSEWHRHGHPPRPIRPDHGAPARYARRRSLGDRAGQSRSPAGPAAPLPAALDPLVQVRPFAADRAGLAVTGEHLGLVREREQLAADALDDGREAGVGIGGVPGAAGKKRVARKEMFTAEQADAAGRVTGRVKSNDFVLAEAKALPILDAMVRLDRHTRFIGLVAREARVGLVAHRLQRLYVAGVAVGREDMADAQALELL